jgi:hypothetical protein
MVFLRPAGPPATCPAAPAVDSFSAASFSAARRPSFPGADLAPVDFASTGLAGATLTGGGFAAALAPTAWRSALATRFNIFAGLEVLTAFSSDLGLLLLVWSGFDFAFLLANEASFCRLRHGSKATS